MGVFDGNVFDANVFDVDSIPQVVTTKGFPPYHETRKRKRRKTLDEERAELRRVIDEAFDGKPKPPEIPPPLPLPYTLPARVDLAAPLADRLKEAALLEQRRQDEEALILLLAA